MLAFGEASLKKSSQNAFQNKLLLVTKILVAVLLRRFVPEFTLNIHISERVS